MNRTESGFTLLEMVIAQTFLAISLIASINIIIFMTVKGNFNRRTTEACNLCQTSMEMLKSIGFDGISNSQKDNLDLNGNSGGIFNRTITVTEGSLPDTKFIEIKVTWKGSKKSHSSSLCTMITKP
ncbi:MAG: type IV pilus modification PilV family protein [bacterium]